MPRPGPNETNPAIHVEDIDWLVDAIGPAPSPDDVARRIAEEDAAKGVDWSQGPAGFDLEPER